MIHSNNHAIVKDGASISSILFQWALIPLQGDRSLDYEFIIKGPVPLIPLPLIPLRASLRLPRVGAKYQPNTPPGVFSESLQGSDIQRRPIGNICSLGCQCMISMTNKKLDKKEIMCYI